MNAMTTWIPTAASVPANSLNAFKEMVTERVAMMDGKVEAIATTEEQHDQKRKQRLNKKV